MIGDVRLLVFYKSEDCQFCKETVEIAEDMVSLSDRVKVEKYDANENRELVQRLGIRFVPATLVIGEQQNTIRWYGIPSGHEFTTYVEDILSMSSNKPKLSVDSISQIASLKNELHVQVFVTPTCPYCPRMSLMAHQAALVNRGIIADVIEAVEFPEVAATYKVMGVPKTIVNEIYRITGLIPEPTFVEFLLYSSGIIQKPSERLQKLVSQTEMEESVHSSGHAPP